YVMADIKLAWATSFAPVRCVLSKTACAAGGPMLRRVINKSREGVCAPERQSSAESLLNPPFTTVIVGVATVVSIFDWTQARVGNNACPNPIGIEGLLVQVAQG